MSNEARPESSQSADGMNFVGSMTVSPDTLIFVEPTTPFEVHVGTNGISADSTTVNIDSPVGPIIPKTKRRSSRTARKELREKLADDGQFEAAMLPAEVINVLPQPRRTFENIPGLADSIAREGIINPSNVVQLDEENAIEYIRVINKIQKTEIQISDLVATPDGINVLIAGERRFRAVKHLKEQGCSDCQDHGATLPESEGRDFIAGCYQRHFDREEVEVRLGKNISARNALNKQSAENMHMRVPPHEDAVFLYNYWQFIQDEDPAYPLAAFAKDAGRSDTTIRDAVKYCNLPDIVRDRVEQEEKAGKIPYGAALEIHRLMQIKDPSSVKEMKDYMDYEDWGDVDVEGKVVTGKFFQMSDEELEGWMNKYIIGELKLTKYREIVTAYIKEREGGQVSMFDIMSENQQAEAEFNLKQKKLVVETNIVRALHGFVQYFTIVQDLYEHGKLQREDSPYSEGSPSRLILKIAQTLEKIVPSMSKDAMSRRNKKKVLDVARHTQEVASEIISYDLNPGEQVTIYSNGNHPENDGEDNFPVPQLGKDTSLFDL